MQKHPHPTNYIFGTLYCNLMIPPTVIFNWKTSSCPSGKELFRGVDFRSMFFNMYKHFCKLFSELEYKCKYDHVNWNQNDHIYMMTFVRCNPLLTTYSRMLLKKGYGTFMQKFQDTHTLSPDQCTTFRIFFLQWSTTKYLSICNISLSMNMRFRFICWYYHVVYI